MYSLHLARRVADRLPHTDPSLLITRSTHTHARRTLIALSLLVVDRGHHLGGRVPPLSIVVVDPGGDRGAGLGAGGEPDPGQQSCSNGGVKDEGLNIDRRGLRQLLQLPLAYSAAVAAGPRSRSNSHRIGATPSRAPHSTHRHAA